MSPRAISQIGLICGHEETRGSNTDVLTINYCNINSMSY